MSSDTEKNDDDLERNVYNQFAWSDREILELVAGLQKYGSSSVLKIAELIGSRNTVQVQEYMNWWMKRVEKPFKRASTTKTVRKKWPSVRKWHKIARTHVTRQEERIAYDFSSPIIRDMCQEFYDEAKETTNPQVVDVKAIYKFLLDCVYGRNPAELMPKESAIVLMLLRKLKEMINNLNLDEEQKFIREFQMPTSFVPFKVKDEFIKKEKEDCKAEFGSVPIPEKLFELMKLHLSLVRSFNPLMVPIWLLDKEQSDLFPAVQSNAEK